MGDSAWLVVAWVSVVFINLAPAFVPPTWIVLAAFRIGVGVPLLPLTLGGAAASALGRTGLALGSRRASHWLPRSQMADIEYLGEWFNGHPRFRLAFVFGFCLGPFPSSALFIAAGAGKVALRPVVIAFFVSRSLSDTFWVWTAHRVAHGLKPVLREGITDWQWLALQALTLGAVAVVFRLPWRRWLANTHGRDDEKEDQRAAGNPPPARMD